MTDAAATVHIHPGIQQQVDAAVEMRLAPIISLLQDQSPATLNVVSHLIEGLKAHTDAINAISQENVFLRERNTLLAERVMGLTNRIAALELAALPPVPLPGLPDQRPVERSFLDHVWPSFRARHR